MKAQLKSAREMFEELGFIVNDNINKGALINNKKWQSVSVIKILDRNYQNGRILYLQKIIRKKNEIIDNLREDNIKLIKRGK